MDFGAEKTKTLTQGSSRSQQPIQIYGQTVEEVVEFCYLGSIISEDGTGKSEVKAMEMKTKSAFGRLWHKVYSKKELTKRTKLMVYTVTAVSVMR